MRIVRIGVVVLTVYVTVGLLFGGFVGYLQPQDGGTARLRTVDANGQKQETVLRLLEDESGQVWLLSGQWFRGWYNRALDHPDVELVRGDTATVYRAVAINDPNTLDSIIRLRRRMEKYEWLVARPCTIAIRTFQSPTSRRAGS